MDDEGEVGGDVVDVVMGLAVVLSGSCSGMEGGNRKDVVVGIESWVMNWDWN